MSYILENLDLLVFTYVSYMYQRQKPDHHNYALCTDNKTPSQTI